MAELDGREVQLGSVLLVEDDADILEMYAEALTEFGLRVSTAPNAEEALRSVAAAQPQIVVTDLSLPRVDGADLCRRLKQNHATRHIPVIAVTGWGLASGAKHAREAGFASVLIKPVLPDALFTEIQRVLQLNDGGGSRV